MRKSWLDNIRWSVVAVVVLYHVFYMYNAEGIPGVCGKITELDVQYFDLFQYFVYPWIMAVLFLVSGISSRLILEKRTDREYLISRTRKLLVPSTIGLFAFQFVQGLVNVSLSGVFEKAPGMPLPAKAAVCVLSGSGVLWTIQMLWLFSLALVLIRKIEKDRLWRACESIGLPALLALVLPAFGAAQVLNTPIIVVYRFGLYFFYFLLGYFVLSHDAVVQVLKWWFPLFLIISLALGAAFCARYFGQNYADVPVNRSVLFVCYGYFASLAVVGGTAKYGDRENAFTRWMSERSFGLYVFHYLGISAVGLFIGRPRLLPAPAVYLLSLLAGFAGAYALNAVISRIPGYRWAVLGIKSPGRPGGRQPEGLSETEKKPCSKTT